MRVQNLLESRERCYIKVTNKINKIKYAHSHSDKTDTGWEPTLQLQRQGRAQKGFHSQSSHVIRFFMESWEIKYTRSHSDKTDTGREPTLQLQRHGRAQKGFHSQSSHSIMGDNIHTQPLRQDRHRTGTHTPASAPWPGPECLAVTASAAELSASVCCDVWLSGAGR